MATDDAEELSFFPTGMPSTDKKLTSDVVLFLPRGNSVNECLPSQWVYPHLLTQCLPVFPYKLKQQLTNIFSHILCYFESKLTPAALAFVFVTVLLVWGRIVVIWFKILFGTLVRQIGGTHFRLILLFALLGLSMWLIRISLRKVE